MNMWNKGLKIVGSLLVFSCISIFTLEAGISVTNRIFRLYYYIRKPIYILLITYIFSNEWPLHGLIHED